MKSVSSGNKYHGKYHLVTEFTKNTEFHFTRRNRRGLLDRVNNPKWKLFSITFTDIDFNVSGQEILEAINKRPDRDDIKIDYVNCIQPETKITHEPTPSKKIEDREPNYTLKELSAHLENAIINAELDDFASDSAIGSYNFIINYLTKKQDKDDEAWRLLSLTAAHRCWFYNKNKNGLLEKEDIYRALESFFHIQNKTRSDFDFVASASELMLSRNDFILNVITNLFSKNPNDKNWEKQFNNLVILAKSIESSKERSFVIDLISYMLDTNTLPFINSSLSSYLSDAKNIQELRDNLSQLKTLHLFYQQFVTQPGHLSENLMHHVEALKTRNRALLDENKKLQQASQKKADLEKNQQAHLNQATSKSTHFGNSSVMYQNNQKRPQRVTTQSTNKSTYSRVK